MPHPGQAPPGPDPHLADLPVYGLDGRVAAVGGDLRGVPQQDVLAFALEPTGSTAGYE